MSKIADELFHLLEDVLPTNRGHGRAQLKRLIEVLGAHAVEAVEANHTAKHSEAAHTTAVLHWRSSNLKLTYCGITISDAIKVITDSPMPHGATCKACLGMLNR